MRLRGGKLRVPIFLSGCASGQSLHAPSLLVGPKVADPGSMAVPASLVFLKFCSDSVSNASFSLDDRPTLCFWQSLGHVGLYGSESLSDQLMLSLNSSGSEKCPIDIASESGLDIPATWKVSLWSCALVVVITRL